MAWTLSISKGPFDTVEIGEDGEIEGMDGALTRLVSRYPWLREDAPLDDGAPEITTAKRMRPPVGSRRQRDNGKQTLTRWHLEKRLPALRRSRLTRPA